MAQLIGIALIAAALLLPSSQASAAVSCTYIAAGKVVAVQTSGDSAAEIKRVGDEIRSTGTDCGDATVTNTDSIVFDHESAGQPVTIDLSGGPLAPGAASETATPEIEVQVAGPNGGYELRVVGGPGEERLRAGTTGVVLNSDLDSDLFGEQPTSLLLRGGDGDDELRAQGGFDTGSAFAGFSRLNGEGGDDTIVGGVDSELEGGPGDDAFGTAGGDSTIVYDSAPAGVTVNLDLTGTPQDTGGAGLDSFEAINKVRGSAHADVLIGSSFANELDGGAGPDVLDPRAGNDKVIGGDDGSTDMVSYAAAPAAVKIDLSATASQSTGGAGGDQILEVEGVIGSEHDDELRGNNASNVLEGRAGNDQLDGFRQNDVLDGGPGVDDADGGLEADELRLRDGAGDAAACGADSDVVIADAPGVDSIAEDCEDVRHPPQPEQPADPPAGPQPGAPQVPVPTGPGATTPSNEFSVASGARLRGNRVRFTLELPGPGTVEADIAGVRASGVTRTVGAGGPLTLSLKLSKKARKLLRRRGAIKLSVRVTYTPTGGAAASELVRLTVKRKRR